MCTSNSSQWRHNGHGGVSITSLTNVYLTIYSDVDQRKHQSSASLDFVRGIHRGPVNSPHKWPVTRKMFPFDDVIMLTSHRPIFFRASIYQADGRLSVRSHEVSKSRDSGLNFSSSGFGMWQAHRQRCCWDTCQISERYDHYSIRSFCFETSRDLAVRRITA